MSSKMKILFHYIELIVWSLVNDTNSAYMLNYHCNYIVCQLDMYSPFQSYVSLDMYSPFQNYVSIRHVQPIPELCVN